MFENEKGILDTAWTQYREWTVRSHELESLKFVYIQPRSVHKEMNACQINISLKIYICV